MFTADDTWAVIRFLGLDETASAAIETRLVEITSLAPQLVAQVQGYLTDLAALDLLIQKSVVTGQSAIKVADDVEFFQRDQLMGLITRMIQLTRQLGRQMKISPDLSTLQELYASISGNTASVEPIAFNKSMN